MTSVKLCCSYITWRPVAVYHGRE